MSPNDQNQYAETFNDTFSPWTECFQTNPLHRDGHYDHNENPEQDESTSPTWQALNAIYDTTERE